VSFLPCHLHDRGGTVYLEKGEKLSGGKVGLEIFPHKRNRETAVKERRRIMGMKGLAEGIIMQSIEDLWNENLRDECISFFRGQEFGICAQAAGMSLDDQVKLLDMVKDILGRGFTTAGEKRTAFAGGRKSFTKTPGRMQRIVQAVP
jgi:hypothetical protein